MCVVKIYCDNCFLTEFFWGGKRIGRGSSVAWSTLIEHVRSVLHKCNDGHAYAPSVFFIELRGSISLVLLHVPSVILLTLSLHVPSHHEQLRLVLTLHFWLVAERPSLEPQRIIDACGRRPYIRSSWRHREQPQQQRPQQPRSCNDEAWQCHRGQRNRSRLSSSRYLGERGCRRERWWRRQLEPSGGFPRCLLKAVLL